MATYFHHCIEWKSVAYLLEFRYGTILGVARAWTDESVKPLIGWRTGIPYLPHELKEEEFAEFIIHASSLRLPDLDGQWYEEGVNEFGEPDGGRPIVDTNPESFIYALGIHERNDVLKRVIARWKELQGTWFTHDERVSLVDHWRRLTGRDFWLESPEGRAEFMRWMEEHGREIVKSWNT